ncbi:hypothetical protein HCC60_07820 [Streptococcus suis]|nr:hypothetical protein [Streptococcus suis]
MKQKDYKSMKRQVHEESALGVGFFDGILQAIPDYALINAVREISSWIGPKTDDADLRNMLVTESIRYLNYQDFKDVAPYLFSYPREQREKDRLVSPVEVSRETYDWLQANVEELFQLKAEIEHANRDLQGKIESLELEQTPSGEEVVGIDREAGELLLYRSPERSYIDDWEVERPGLINDHRSSLTTAELAMTRLMELGDTNIQTMAYSYVMNQDDRIDGIVLVDKEEIAEISSHLVPDFTSHQAFYRYAKNYGSFREIYPDYATYIERKHNLFYQGNYALRFYAEDFLKDNLKDVNAFLSQSNQELIYTSISDHQLAYLRDTKTESRKEVFDYLEHQVVAHYQGELAELAVIKLANIHPKDGFNGKQEDVYRIDDKELKGNKLEAIQSRYPGLHRFISPSVAQEQHKSLQQDKPRKSL